MWHDLILTIEEAAFSNLLESLVELFLSYELVWPIWPNTVDHQQEVYLSVVFYTTLSSSTSCSVLLPHELKVHLDFISPWCGLLVMLTGVHLLGLLLEDILLGGCLGKSMLVIELLGTFLIRSLITCRREDFLTRVHFFDLNQAFSGAWCLVEQLKGCHLMWVTGCGTRLGTDWRGMLAWQTFAFQLCQEWWFLSFDSRWEHIYVTGLIELDIASLGYSRRPVE